MKRLVVVALSVLGLLHPLLPPDALASNHFREGSQVSPGYCPVNVSTDKPDGQVRSFARCSIGWAVGDDMSMLERAHTLLVFIEPDGDDWRMDPSPYTGSALAMAHDGESTFVVFTNRDGFHLGRRDSSGSFDAPLELDSISASSATLVAKGGKFWVVWARQDVLYEAKTLGTPTSKRQLTTDGKSGEPSLALASDGRAYLAWARFLRYQNADGVGGSDPRIEVRIAERRGERWISRHFSPGNGKVNVAPRVALDAKNVYVGFIRDEVVVMSTTNRANPRHFSTHSFGVTGCGWYPPPYLAQRGNRMAMAWTVCHPETLRDRHAVVADRTSTGWTRPQKVNDATPEDAEFSKYGQVVVGVFLPRSGLDILILGASGATQMRHAP